VKQSAIDMSMSDDDEQKPSKSPSANVWVFEGTVKHFDEETKWHKIFYTDGDEEDMRLDELKECISSSSNASENCISTFQHQMCAPKKRKRSQKNVRFASRWVVVETS
jgi:hypothetical protein